MLNLLSWIGLVIFAVALSFDFYREWLAPRLLSRSWFPGEPDLPPVAGEVDEAEPEDVDRVLLAGYLTGVVILFVGLLDVAPVNPGCLPYGDFLNQYVVRLFTAMTALMWYSEGRDVVIPYHSEIRYTIGLLALIIPLYSEACGSGVI